MRKYLPTLIIIVGGVSLLSCTTFIWIGWNGIGKEVKIEESGCEASYVSYYITPFIKDEYESRETYSYPKAARKHD